MLVIVRMFDFSFVLESLNMLSLNSALLLGSPGNSRGRRCNSYFSNVALEPAELGTKATISDFS